MIIAQYVTTHRPQVVLMLLVSAIHVRAEFRRASPEQQSLHQIRKLSGNEFGGKRRFLVRDQPKYIPVKPEQVAKLLPEKRQEYESLEFYN